MRKITKYVSMVYPFLEEILYNIAIYRTGIKNTDIKDGIIEDPYYTELWVIIRNNALQMAIINWCKVFGSEKDNQFHYIKHGIDLGNIEKVKRPMVQFRNKYIAHKTEKEVPVPVLDKAIQIIYSFDKIIREKYDLDGYPELKNSYESYLLIVDDLLSQ